MSNKQRQQVDRREFIRGVFRRGLLGVLAVGAGAIGVKRARSGTDDKCVNDGVCRGCGAFGGCELPQAQSAKQAVAQGEISEEWFQPADEQNEKK
jgi:hypothetical protein